MVRIIFYFSSHKLKQKTSTLSICYQDYLPLSEIKTKTMEIHHHPDLHHRKKRWREYFIEFIMIFLAVTLGFFAESYRESRADRSKEMEYIKAMLEDAQTDTANYQEAINLNMIRAGVLDSLARLCYNYNGNSDKDIYRLYRRALRHPDFANPTERTLMQLKNSGGMRMLQRKVAVDSIINYDDFAKKLGDQRDAYTKFLAGIMEESMDMINHDNYAFDTASSIAVRVFEANKTPKLMNTDKTKLIKFGNREMSFKGVVLFYMVRLREGKQHALNLITTLRREYKPE